MKKLPLWAPTTISLVGLLLLLGIGLPHPAGLMALQKGESLFSSGHYTEAEVAYQEALKSLPQDPQPALRLAKLYAVWGYPEEGLAALDEAMARGMESNRATALELELLTEAERWPQAEELAQTALKANSQSSEILSKLTDSLLNQGKCDEAAAAAAQWKQASPHDPHALRIWGTLNLDKEPAAARLALCQADTALCQAAQERGTSASENLILGQVLIRQGSWPLAVCVLEHAASAAPQSAEAQAWWGTALERSGRPQQALPHLQQAVQLAPESPLGWLELGTHYLNQNQINAAREALLKAHQFDRENPATCLAIATLLAAEGNYADTLNWTETATGYAPEDPNVWKAVARFYLERDLQQDPEPLRSAQKAVDLAPENAEAWMLLGWAELMQGRSETALQILEKSLSLESAPSAQAYYLRGRALQLLGREEEALKSFTQAANLGYRRTPQSP